MDNPSFELSEAADHCASLRIRNEGRTLESPTDAKESSPDIVCLQRKLGFFRCVGLGIGTVIGSGIFISPKGVLQGSGSVGLTIMIWFLCGCISLLGAISLSELGTLIPSSGGEYMYIMEAFAPNRRKKKTFFGPLPGFIFSWQSNFFLRPASFAIQGLTVAKYIIRLTNYTCFFNGMNPDTEQETNILASLILTIISIVNCRSVKLSTGIVNGFTFAKVAVLVLVIIGGITQAWQGKNEALKTGFEGTRLTFNGISEAFFSGLWAFGGWSNLSGVVRELKNPNRDLLRSMTTSLATVTVLYVLTNISYFIVMTKEEFLLSEEVAVNFASKLLGAYGATLITFSVACSVIGASFGNTFTGVRTFYAAAREGHVMNFLCFLDIKFMTPVPALLFNLLISLFLIQQSSVLGLISLLGFLDWAFMAIIMISLLILRKTKRDEKRVVKVPLFVPLVVFGFSVFMVVIPFIESPKIEYIYGLLFLLLGVIIYIPFVYYSVKIPFLNNVYIFLQKILHVAPPEDDEI